MAEQHRAWKRQGEAFLAQEWTVTTQASISRTLVLNLADAICSHPRFAGEENEMADEHQARQRYGEAFWRAHHEAWKRNDLNQREYCEAQGIPLKAFGNWRASSKPSHSRQ
jgi:hypothetical protein